MLTNDQARPVPQTEFASPLLIFDLPGLQIGVAEYAEGPTGCTVFLFPDCVALAWLIEDAVQEGVHLCCRCP